MNVVNHPTHEPTRLYKARGAHVDVIQHQGSIWICREQHVAGSVFDKSYWHLLQEKATPPKIDYPKIGLFVRLELENQCRELYREAADKEFTETLAEVEEVFL